MAEAVPAGFLTNQPSGTGILREYWHTIKGATVRSLTSIPNYPLNPDFRDVRPQFSAPNHWNQNYGQRLRGLLLAPATGNYTFWIASDDNAELWLSADDNPANKRRIALVPDWTPSREWVRYPEQRSDGIWLQKDKTYYIEALHKQGVGFEELDVAWQGPERVRELISGDWLKPYNNGLGGEGITREVWTNTPGSAVSNFDLATAFTSSPHRFEQLLQFEAPASLENNYVERLHGYIHPPVSGVYTFCIAGDESARLWLSTDDTPTHKQLIAKTSRTTGPREWNLYPEQYSFPVKLEAGKTYYIEAFHKQSATNNHLSIGWHLPNGTSERPISAARLTPYDSDYDGIPDWYEVRHGFAPHDPDDAHADADHDGLANREEFRHDTNPFLADNPSKFPSILFVEQIRNAAHTPLGEKVQLRGVVTYTFARNADFFLQDGTGGIYVEAKGRLREPLRPGQRVEIDGTVTGDSIVPNVALSNVIILDRAAFPKARAVTYEQAIAGRANGERIDMNGIVRSASIQDDLFYGKQFVLTITTLRGQFTIRCPELPSGSLQSWVDSFIRVRGVAGGMFSSQERLIGLVVYAPFLTDIYVDTVPSWDLFNVPERTVQSLFQLSGNSEAGHRVKVVGTVLYSEPGKMLYLRDQTGALQVFTSQTEPVHAGDTLQVLGFAALGDYSSVLQDAIFRKVNSDSKVSGIHVEPADILKGKFNCDLVTIQGTLIDYIHDSEKQGFWLQSGSTLFDVYWNATNGLPSASRVEKGSVLKVTGIALVKVSSLTKMPQTFHLFLPSAEEITVLKQPTWWTLKRLVWTVSVLIAAILLGAGWVAVLSKRKTQLEQEILRRKQAEEELQEAHKEQREKAEAEFQAIFGERTRIAQELHDTLEQGLVGISLQLDMVDDVILEDAKLGREHLHLAQRLLESSQAETRRSVWDLRSEKLEHGNLLSALNEVVSQLSDGSNVTIYLTSNGTQIPLPVLIENNLFRIGQEALTNAIKHARANRVLVSIDFEMDSVLLQIQDNGIGFDLDNPLPDGSHFGLQGIRERVIRLGGKLDLKSGSQQGTQIRVRVPISSNGSKPIQRE